MLGAAVMGLAIGSFLNVCIARLPVDLSVVRPRSRCPQCEKEIIWRDNIPVLSWILLRGKCRNCGKGISIQYPLVEIGVALLWVWGVWQYGVSLNAAAAIVFSTILVGIAMTDLQTYIIPNEYTLGGLVVGLALAALNGVPALISSATGAAVGFGLLLTVAYLGEKAFGQEAMGGGDIKMMAMVGAFIGWKGVLLTIFGGALFGSIVFVPLSLFGIKKLVPFGVFLSPAAFVAFVWGDAIIGWYVKTMLSG